MKFQILEHTADIYIAAYGENLEEALENAALAMFEAMTDANKIEPELEEHIEVEGYDEKSLLYNWLEALLVRFEVTDRLYSQFRIASLEKAEEGLKLKATIKGEKYNPKKHVSKVGVKAVTYHQMEITKKRNKATVKFILDI